MRNNRKKCLVCKEPMVRWIFGMPDYESVKEGLENNTILIGGCIISDNDPTWTCLHCCISYRYDGVGYVDKEFIENRAYNTPTYSSDKNEKFEVPPYQLPDKIQNLLKDDFFLKHPTSTRTTGFYFHLGGYNSYVKDIRYLDGILIFEEFESQMEYYLHKRKPNQLPNNVFILSPAWKKILNTFLISSKWKRNYVDLGIMDGTQWELTRLFQKKKKNTYGSNEFPEVYEELMEILEEIEMGITNGILGKFV
jgi:hypothetical protein